MRTKQIVASAFFSWLGVATGNFVYEAMKHQQYGSAVEHSWFQLVAVAVFAGILISQRSDAE